MKLNRHVAAMCDQIHTVNWSAEIVLCEILPRGPDNRRGAKRPQQDKTTLKRWVRTANNLLWDLCQRVPYIRFLGYPGFCEVCILTKLFLPHLCLRKKQGAIVNTETSSVLLVCIGI